MCPQNKHKFWVSGERKKRNLSRKQKMSAIDNQTVLLLCLSLTSNKIVAGLYNERILKRVNFNYRSQSGIESKV